MPDRMTKDQYREQWMKAQEEIALLIHRGQRLQQLMPSLYEGVLAEKAPDYEPEIRWEREHAG
jgi:hypothetical protein